MKLVSVASIALVMFAGAALASETVTYSYDARGRLVEVNHSGGPASGTKVEYQYDDAHNIKRKRVTGA